MLENSQIVDWPEDRQCVAFMQLHLKSLGIETGEIDGYFGPQTEHAYETWRDTVRAGREPEPWRDDDIPGPKRPDDTLLWPQYDDLTRFYGEPGTNLTRLALPYPMKLAWDLSKEITGFSIHERCHDSALHVFNLIASHYSPEDIERHGFNLFAGCLASPPRKMRGGTSFSTHSWAIAIDFDSLRNKLKWGKDRAYLAKPECEQFWGFWEDAGWTSLGRQKNYDWMHVQASRL